MGLFQKDARAALDRTQVALAQTETKLADLVRKRDESLLADDDINAIEKLDRQIATLRSAAGIHRDKIAVLEAQLKREANAAQAREYAQRIAQFETRYAKVAESAAALDKDLRGVVQQYRDLVEQAKSASAAWPFTAMDQRIGLLTNTAIHNAVADHLHHIGGSAVGFPGAKRPIGIEPGEFLAEGFVRAGKYLSGIIRQRAVAENYGTPADSADEMQVAS
jgi:hypothetical protein